MLRIFEDLCITRLWNAETSENLKLVKHSNARFKKVAKRLQEKKGKPEIEAFDLGNTLFGSTL